MIKTLDTKTVYKNKWMEVREDQVLFPDGHQGMYGYVVKPDTSLIIPFDGHKFTLVKQYRYPIQEWSWEFPIGHNEDVKDTQALAIQELEEETGLLAGKLELLGSVYVGNGLVTTKTYVYLATNLSAGIQQLEPTEQGLEVHQLSFTQITQMINTGEFSDGPSVSAVSLLLLKKPQLCQ